MHSHVCVDTRPHAHGHIIRGYTWDLFSARVQSWFHAVAHAEEAESAQRPTALREILRCGPYRLSRDALWPIAQKLIAN